jgi:hypothetical protein
LFLRDLRGRGWRLTLPDRYCCSRLVILRIHITLSTPPGDVNSMGYFPLGEIPRYGHSELELVCCLRSKCPSPLKVVPVFVLWRGWSEGEC